MGLKKLEEKQALNLYEYDPNPMVLVIITAEKNQYLKKNLRSKRNGRIFLSDSVLQQNCARSTYLESHIAEIAKKCLSEDWSFSIICFESKNNFENKFNLFQTLPLTTHNESLKEVSDFTRSNLLLGDSTDFVPSRCSYSQVILGFMRDDSDRKIQKLSPMFSQLRIQATDSIRSISPQKKSPHDVKDQVPRDQDKKFVQTPTSLMFAVLGWSGNSPTVTIEAYDPNAQKWFYLSQNTFVRRAYHGVVMLGILIYVIGGFDGRCCHNTTFCFHVEKRHWYKRPSMRTARCYVTALGCRGMVYALGGFDGDERFKCCERFDPRTRQWRYFASMNDRRSDASGAVHNGKIYVSGGFNGVQVLSSSEVYDPQTDQWTLIPSMLGPRSGHCLASHRGMLLVVGGFDGHTRLRTVEKYDEERNAWIEFTPMLNVRSNFATAVLQDQLYVIGGFNGVTTSSEVERFDDVLKTWDRAPGLNKHRSALGACVFSDSMIVSMCSIPGQIVLQASNVEQSSP